MELLLINPFWIKAMIFIYVVGTAGGILFALSYLWAEGIDKNPMPDEPIEWP